MSLACAPFPQPQPQKTTGSPLPPCLINASCTLVDNKVYVFGGYHMWTADVFNDIYVLNLVDNVWKRLDHIKGNWPCPRNSHTTTYWKDGKLVIFGGNDMNDDSLNDLYILHLKTLTWEKPEMLGDVPDGRARHSALIHNDKLYIVGGCRDRDDVVGTLHVLDLNTFRWDPAIHFARRYSHFCTVFENRLYVYGGMLPSHAFASDVAFMDLADFTVTKISITSDQAPPPEALGQHFTQLSGSSLIIIKAPSLKLLETSAPSGIWSLSLTSLRWTQHTTTSPLSTHSFHYYAMAPNSQNFILFASDSSNEESNLSLILTLDLEAYGIIYIPPPKLSPSFASLLSNPTSSDYTIQSTDPNTPPIPVHTLILTTRWPHFSNLLASGMSESQSQTLILSDPYDAIKSFLHYLYTDQLTGTIPTISHLLVMANRYCLDRLQKLCSAYLHQNVDIKHVAMVFGKASQGNERGLKHRALQTILERFGEVVRTKGFRELEKEVWEEVWEWVPKEAAVSVTGQGQGS